MSEVGDVFVVLRDRPIRHVIAAIYPHATKSDVTITEVVCGEAYQFGSNPNDLDAVDCAACNWVAGMPEEAEIADDGTLVEIAAPVIVDPLPEDGDTVSYEVPS